MKIQGILQLNKGNKYLKHYEQRNWRTVKIYMAGLCWYYKHMLNNVGTAKFIPYPKYKKTLPKIISRKELAKLFDACFSQKHRKCFGLSIL